MNSNNPWIKYQVPIPYDGWACKNRTHFSSLLLSALMNWERFIEHQSNIDDIHKRQYDEIESAIDGMVSDLHNLAINYHLMVSILEDEKCKIMGLRGLYIELLVENYITNIRSIYDFCSVFPRILMSTENIEGYKKKHNIQSDSLIRMMSVLSGQNPEFLSELPEYMKFIIKNTKAQLKDINDVRNWIVHHGKETFVQFDESNVAFRIPEKYPNDKTNKLPNILQLNNDVVDYPLFDYLKKLTYDLLSFMENLGIIMLVEKQDCRSNLWILDNICMESFINFVQYDITRHIRKNETGKLDLINII